MRYSSSSAHAFASFFFFSFQSRFPALRRESKLSLSVFRLLARARIVGGGVTAMARLSSSVTRKSRACALASLFRSLSLSILARTLRRHNHSLPVSPSPFPRSGANLSERVASPLVRREFGRGRDGARGHNRRKHVTARCISAYLFAIVPNHQGAKRVSPASKETRKRGALCVRNCVIFFFGSVVPFFVPEVFVFLFFFSFASLRSL